MKIIKKFGKVLSAVLLCLKKFSYHLLSFVSFILLVFTVSAFLFFVFIKTDPHRAALFTTKFLEKLLPVLHVKSEHIATTIHNENITINIPHFKRHTKDVEIEGYNAKIAFSISDILHGRLYKITIENFLMNISTNKEKSTYNPHALASFYYSFMPSFKMDIQDFILNLNNNKIYINDAILKVNQRGYILFLQANSKQYGYDFKVTLNSKKLHVSFNNIPSKILHKYTENKLNFLHFSSATGFISLDAQDTRNTNFEILLKSVSLLKSQFINEETKLSDFTIFGSSSVSSMSVITSPFTINGKTGASFDIHTNKGNHELGFDIKNITIEEIKKLVALKNINGEPLKTVVKYLESSLKSGNVTHCEGKINIPVVKDADLNLKIAFQNTNFEYHPQFAIIENANGNVEVAPNKTTIMVQNGKSAGNILKNSIVEITNNKVKISTNTSGTVKSLTDIFKADYITPFFPASGNITTKTVLEIDTTCKDIYHCMGIISKGKISNFQTEFNTNTANVAANANVLFEKKANQNAFIKLDLQNFTNEYLGFSKLEADVVPTNDYKNLELKIHGQNHNGEEILAKSIKINTESGVIDEISIPKIKFQQNDFSFKYSNNAMEFKGNTLNVPETYNFLSKFQIIREPFKQKPKNSSTNETKFNFLLSKIIFHNNIEAFASGEIEMRGIRIKKAIIDSEIFSFHYFLPEIEEKLSQELREQGLFIEVPDISILLSAVIKGEENAVKSGSIKIIGKRHPIESGIITWTGNVENLHTKSEKFKLSTRKIKIFATQKGNEISFKNLKIQDSNHTIFVSGTIFTDTMTIKAKIFYTPSKVEAVNEIPLIKNAIKVTSFGSSSNGILSLELDVTGSIFAPEVKFNKVSPIKSLWKIIVSIPFLPFLIL